MKAWDVFISHASEDNDAVAVPLARLLHRAGARVWLDRHEISLGDRLREKLDEGLAQSRYGVVVLSPHFLGKVWTNRELGALLSLEEGGEKVLLPVWHNVDKGELRKYSPLLADRVAVSTAAGLQVVSDEITNVLFYSKSEYSGGRLPLAQALLRALDGGLSSTRVFLAHHPRLLASLASDYLFDARVVIQPAIGPTVRPDFCIGSHVPNYNAHIWTILSLAAIDCTIVDERGAPSDELREAINGLDSTIKQVTGHPELETIDTIGLSGRGLTAEEQDGWEFRSPVTSGLILAGRREQLTSEHRQKLISLNSSLRIKSIEVRTYDVLADKCAHIMRWADDGPTVCGDIERVVE